MKNTFYWCYIAMRKWYRRGSHKSELKEAKLLYIMGSFEREQGAQSRDWGRVLGAISRKMCSALRLFMKRFIAFICRLWVMDGMHFKFLQCEPQITPWHLRITLSRSTELFFERPTNNYSCIDERTLRCCVYRPIRIYNFIFIHVWGVTKTC